MTPPDRPLPVWARPGSRTGGNPGGDTGDDTGDDSAGELLWCALRAVNVHDLVVFPVRSGARRPPCAAGSTWRPKTGHSCGAGSASSAATRDRHRPLRAAGDRPRRRPRPHATAAVALGPARTRRVRPARRRGR